MPGSLTATFSVVDQTGPVCSSMGAPSHSAPLMPSTAVIEVSWKEREDAIGATEDARREAKEERVAAAAAEDVRDAAQAEADHLREELEGVGRSPSLFLLPIASRLQATFMHYFNISNLCW